MRDPSASQTSTIFKDLYLKLGWVILSFNPSTKESRQGDLYEFKASPVYGVSKV